MTKKVKKKLKVAVIDFETDPFMFDRVPEPFCVEFYSDTITEVFWGDDCTDRLADFLESLDDEYMIFAHNGGKFDFHFLHKYIDNPALIIKTRIVECKLFQHTLRDSFAILPVPLRDFDKGEIDYAKMEREVREAHKAEILVYLHRDCYSLFNAVSAFIDRFGPRLTIGGTAIDEIRKLHPFHKQGSKHDAIFRPYYKGGRVQVFKGGILQGPWKLVDVNGMYPSVMKDKLHPTGGMYSCSNQIPDNYEKPFFVRFIGANKNAIPSVGEDGSLVFDKEYGEFYACSHELEVALKHDLVRIDEVIECYVAQETISFGEFVDSYADAKAEAKRIGDILNYIFNKLIPNSGYGRFGINPENFEDWVIHRDFGNEGLLELNGYTQQCDYGDLELWAKPAQVKEEQYCDVAIAASITSAARARLLEGLQYADMPIYCDTDSIICRDFHGPIDPYKLGYWDIEKECETVAIAGKKLYCLYTGTEKIKISSKGGTLSMNEIIRLCNGETVRYDNPAPTFSLHKPPSFVSRNFKKTAA